MKINLNKSQDEENKLLQVMHSLVEKLVSAKPIYRCENCGFSSKSIHWQCPGCKFWGKLKPIHGIDNI